MSCDSSDCKEFQQYHKNKINRMVHIVCFMIGIVCVTLLTEPYIGPMIPIIYIMLVWLSWKNIFLLGVVSLLLFITYNTLKLYPISQLTLLGILALSYIIPELSHIILKEPTYLYQRVAREQSAYAMAKKTITHAVNLVLFCLLK